jgi:tRNA A37 N6-isopentenylltransferase MiaA
MDADSRVAKSIDEQMSSEGWNPTDEDYWDELDSRLQKVLPHRYNESNDDENRQVRRPRNVVASSGREASAAYGGTNRTQFVLSPDRVKAMKDAGAWDPERKARMIKNFIAFDRANGIRN